LQEELRLLTPLPAADWYEPKQYSVTVTGWSTVSLAGATYSVPSRFIGQKLKALVDNDWVAIYYAQHLVLKVPRHQSGERCINYRHLIFHLLRKPGAFRNYQYREELFPRVIFRKAYDVLLAQDDEKADKEYLRILNTATLEGEEQVAAALELLLECGSAIRSDKVHELCKSPKATPEVEVLMPNLEAYDALLKNTTNWESTR
jgi:hypothetical protein